MTFIHHRVKGEPLQAFMNGLAKHVAAWEAEGRDKTKLPYGSSWLSVEAWKEDPAMPDISPFAAARCGTAAGPPRPRNRDVYDPDPFDTPEDAERKRAARERCQAARAKALNL